MATERAGGFADFVRRFSALLDEGRRIPLAPAAAPERPAAKPGAPRVLILAPHPDDECIVGGLPLRLARELGWSVRVAAVTCGSRVDRRAPRVDELRGACAYLGWDVVAGLNGEPEELARLLAAEKPRAVLLPHSGDANATHQEVHRLALDALKSLGPDFRCATVETEFWGTLPDPNLLVESTEADAADLVAALSFHKGEVERNPYHVLLPCWLSDNVRRGGELVGGQGAAPPPFRFGTLYRLGRWTGRAIERAAGAGRLVPAGSGLDSLFA